MNGQLVLSLSDYVSLLKKIAVAYVCPFQFFEK